MSVQEKAHSKCYEIYIHYFCISAIHYQQNKAWPRRQASTSSFSDWKNLHCRKGARETVRAGAQEGLLESIAFSVQQGHYTQKLTATLVKCMCLFKIKTGNCPPLGGGQGNLHLVNEFSQLKTGEEKSVLKVVSVRLPMNP